MAATTRQSERRIQGRLSGVIEKGSVAVWIPVTVRCAEDFDRGVGAEGWCLKMTYICE
jgi:hypothetical protein